MYECFGKLGIVLIFGLPTNTRQSMVHIHSNSCLSIAIACLSYSSCLLYLCVLYRIVKATICIFLFVGYIQNYRFLVCLATPVTESRHDITFTVPQHLSLFLFSIILNINCSPSDLCHLLFLRYNYIIILYPDDNRA